MNAVEGITRRLTGEEATWVGLAAGGWLVALLVALVAVWQAARADRLCVRAAETAHELRGPLCAARLALDSLERAHPALPRLTAVVAAIDLELRRAGLAVDALGRLDAIGSSGFAAGSLSESVDVKALAAAAEPAWRALAAAHDTTLELMIGGGPALAAGDPRRIHQGIGNLVANACEHGRGPVRVTVVGDGETARVEVADGGPGPSAELLKRACRRARRGSTARAAPSQRGHGLAIAARVARECGGRLGMRATSRGAIVILELSPDRRSGATRWKRLGGGSRRDRRIAAESALPSAGLRSALPRAR